MSQRQRTFRCKAPALIRAGFPVNSTERGILEIGVMIVAQRVRRNDRLGVTRVKLDKGWVSCSADDGTVLLAELDADGNEEDEPQSDCGSDMADFMADFGSDSEDGELPAAPPAAAQQRAQLAAQPEPEPEPELELQQPGPEQRLQQDQHDDTSLWSVLQSSFRRSDAPRTVASTFTAVSGWYLK